MSEAIRSGNGARRLREALSCISTSLRSGRVKQFCETVSTGKSPSFAWRFANASFAKDA